MDEETNELMDKRWGNIREGDKKRTREDNSIGKQQQRITGNPQG
jgi:hypothetical protein